jgi:hypothetical protein
LGLTIEPLPTGRPYYKTAGVDYIDTEDTRVGTEAVSVRFRAHLGCLVTESRGLARDPFLAAAIECVLDL